VKKSKCSKKVKSFKKKSRFSKKSKFSKSKSKFSKKKVWIFKKKSKFFKGYQRQLTYRRQDGSYAAFGERDATGSMWLTAFVLNSYSQVLYLYFLPIIFYILYLIGITYTFILEFFPKKICILLLGISVYLH